MHRVEHLNSVGWSVVWCVGYCVDCPVHAIFMCVFRLPSVATAIRTRRAPAPESSTRRHTEIHERRTQRNFANWRMRINEVILCLIYHWPGSFAGEHTCCVWAERTLYKYERRKVWWETICTTTMSPCANWRRMKIVLLFVVRHFVIWNCAARISKSKLKRQNWNEHVAHKRNEFVLHKRDIHGTLRIVICKRGPAKVLVFTRFSFIFGVSDRSPFRKINI